MTHSTPHLSERARGVSSALSLIVACGMVLSLAACSSAPQYYIPQPGSERGLGMVHLVSEGEHLASIARYYRRDIDVLVQLNRLEDPDALWPGEAIYIPPDNSVRVVVDKRITLEEIDAQRRYYGGKEVANKGTKTARRPKSHVKPAKPTPARLERKKAGKIKRVVNEPAPTPPPPPTGGQRDYAWPVAGRYVRGFTTSLFGKPHVGVDIAAPKGRAIQAARRGSVLFAGSSRAMRTYGNLVIVDHGDGFSTLYAHCSEVLVHTGQHVEADDEIARVGSTGRSTGNHLHFEVRYKGVAVDPEKYLPVFPNKRALASKR